MKNFSKYLLLPLLAFVALASCSESDEVSEYADWANKNSAYITSIANEAKNSSTGEWKRILAVGLDPDVEWSDEYYVYCKVLASGTGDETPMSSDVVWVNYSGKLIDGYVFDATYSGELDPEYETPMMLNLDECVPGFSAAVQQMVKGDIWEVTIPADLGYGANDYSHIRPYSTLIFTINLVDFARTEEE